MTADIAPTPEQDPIPSSDEVRPDVIDPATAQVEASAPQKSAPAEPECGRRACTKFTTVDSLFGPPEKPDSSVEAGHVYEAGEGVNLIRRTFFVMSSDFLDYLLMFASLDVKPSRMSDSAKKKARKDLDGLGCTAEFADFTLGGIEILLCDHCSACGSETSISCVFIEEAKKHP